MNIRTATGHMGNMTPLRRIEYAIRSWLAHWLAVWHNWRYRAVPDLDETQFYDLAYGRILEQHEKEWIELARNGKIILKR